MAKISEQIKILQHLKKEHGDIEVYTYLPYEQSYHPIGKFYFEKAESKPISMFGSMKDLPDMVVFYS